MSATDSRDWEFLRTQHPWIVRPGERTEVGQQVSAPVVDLPGLPQLSALLSSARTTPLDIAGERFELLAWGVDEGRQGWLCLPPPERVPEVFPVLRLVWSAMGGIVEHFGRAPSAWWWLNCGDVLTRRSLDVSFTEALEACRWIWEDDGLPVPVSPGDYDVVAVEANGNLTLAHRSTGQVLWFAPDHDAEGVTVLPGCPEYSLYTFDDVPDLASWIEHGVRQWAG